MHSRLLFWLGLTSILANNASAEKTSPVKETVLFRAGEEGYPAYRIPSLLTTKRGVVLAFCEARQAGDHSHNDLALKRSTDGGRTWGPLRVIVRHPKDAFNNPTSICLRESGRVFLFYEHYPDGTGEQKVVPGYEGQVVTTYLMHSDDDGSTWSKPRNISQQVKKETEWTSLASGEGVAIQLRRGPHVGRIVVPANHGPHDQWHAFCYFSDDGGENWKFGGDTQEFLNECQVVERIDGSLLVNARNYAEKGFRGLAISRDSGLTWEATGHDKTLIEPTCQASFIRYSDPLDGEPSRLLFSNPAHQTKRVRMTVRVSRDEGKTWPVARLLYEGPSAYSCLTRLPSGDVGILYEAGEKSAYETIRLARFPIAWLEAGIHFSERVIADKYDYAYGVQAADLDGDGDLDLTSQNIIGEPINLSSMWWFENDGKGSFERHLIHKDDQDIGWFERHTVGDVNGDGKVDVVVVDNKFGRLVWFANMDHPAERPWQRHIITTKSPRVYNVVLADLDGDGDLDAADAGYGNSQNCWYENPGPDGWDDEWARRVVGDKMSEAREIDVGDFNGDGKIDLFAAAVGAENVPPDVTDVKQHGSRIVWYENSGRPAEGPWIRHVIDNTSRAAIHGHPTDLDGDGDLDVVMAHGMRQKLLPPDRHDVAWYENVGRPGKGLEWKRHRISLLPFAFEAVDSDVDGDGDVDVVVSAWAKGDRVVWFENHGDPRGEWTQHIVTADFKAANQVIVADLNGDGRPDLAGTADSGSSRVVGAQELRWWRNEGE